MAAVATASSKTAASLTPPSSSHGNQAWNLAVPADTPIDDITSYYTAGPPNKSQNGSRTRKGSFPIAVAKGRSVSVDNTNPNAMTKQNGTSKSPPASTSPTNHDTIARTSQRDLLTPRAPTLSREGSNQSTGGDSVIDLYSQRLSTNTINESYPNVNSSLTAMYDLSGDVDNTEGSRWIYRDKLLRIENQELGGKSPKSTKAISVLRDRSNSNTREFSNHERTPGKGSVADNDSESHLAQVFDDGDFDLRSAEEKENDKQTPMRNRQLSRMASYSRIPLASSSPVPVPIEYIERNKPLHRPESGEYETDLDNIYTRSRQRSQSVGSSILLDSEQNPQPAAAAVPAPQTLSTPKTRTGTGKQAVTPSPRRPSSANKNSSFNHKSSRSRSQPGLNRLPSERTSGTASGSKHSAPEGPPPWALSSYSPDPKLPPDQQLIPTVARRLQQEQWEREGLYASVYDRELRPLKVHDDDVAIGKDGEPVTKEKEPQWPLGGKPPTMAPVIQDSPPRVEPAQIQPIRVQDPGEDDGKKKKSKGCCCLIM